MRIALLKGTDHGCKGIFFVCRGEGENMRKKFQKRLLSGSFTGISV